MNGGVFRKPPNSKLHQIFFEVLGISCVNTHSHASWGVRKTRGAWRFELADEAVYSKLLVQRMVNCVAQHLPQNFLQNTWKLFRLHILLPQAGAQHRLQPPLIPEYAVIEWTPDAPAAPPCKVLQTPWIAGDTDKGENDKGDKSGGDTD